MPIPSITFGFAVRRSESYQSVEAQESITIVFPVDDQPNTLADARERTSDTRAALLADVTKNAAAAIDSVLGHGSFEDSGAADFAQLFSEGDDLSEPEE